MTMQIGYLEIVTPDPEGTCASLAAQLGASFSDPVPTMGGARVADLAGGGRVGVRAPMHETEAPVTRPYWLSSDIQASWTAALESGGEEMHPPMEIPGEGWFAIYKRAGVEHALWQH